MIACRSLSLLYFPLKYLLSQHHTIGLQCWGWWDLVWYRVVEAWLTGEAGGNKREHTGVSAALLLTWASCLDLAWPAYTRQVHPSSPRFWPSFLVWLVLGMWPALLMKTVSKGGWARSQLVGVTPDLAVWWQWKSLQSLLIIWCDSLWLKRDTHFYVLHSPQSGPDLPKPTSQPPPILCPSRVPFFVSWKINLNQGTFQS